MNILERIMAGLRNFLTPDMTPEEAKAALETRASKSDEKLDWQHSIVDLMKLLGLDSSLTARKELAKELGYTGPLDGSAEMNVWLHKEVVKEVAERDIPIPL